MSGGNVTVANLPTQTVMASGDSVWGWSATGSYTYQVFPSQMVTAGINNLVTATAATAGAIALPSLVVGFIDVTIGGVTRKIAYYAV